jgi:putative sporulation protein YtaF
LTFSIGALVFRIMVKPEAADLDRSRHISPMEAILLGLALGIDNMVAASAASLGGFLPMYAPLAMGVVQASLLAAGIYGCEWLIDHRLRFRLPYVSGTVLITLGLVRLI